MSRLAQPPSPWPSQATGVQDKRLEKISLLPQKPDTYSKPAALTVTVSAEP